MAETFVEFFELLSVGVSLVDCVDVVVNTVDKRVHVFIPRLGHIVLDAVDDVLLLCGSNTDTVVFGQEVLYMGEYFGCLVVVVPTGEDTLDATERFFLLFAESASYFGEVVEFALLDHLFADFVDDSLAGCSKVEEAAFFVGVFGKDIGVKLVETVESLPVLVSTFNTGFEFRK